MRRKQEKEQCIAIRGMIRGQLVDHKTGKVVGDTGWVKNVITQYGLQNLARLLAAGTTSGVVIASAVLGTSTASIASTATNLGASTNAYKAVVLSTSGNATLTATATFAGSALTGSCQVAEAGLFAASTGTMICGQAFASSSWATNQDFNLTYEVRFSNAS